MEEIVPAHELADSLRRLSDAISRDYPEAMGDLEWFAGRYRETRRKELLLQIANAFRAMMLHQREIGWALIRYGDMLTAACVELAKHRQGDLEPRSGEFVASNFHHVCYHELSAYFAAFTMPLTEAHDLETAGGDFWAEFERTIEEESKNSDKLYLDLVTKQIDKIMVWAAQVKGTPASFPAVPRACSLKLDRERAQALMLYQFFPLVKKAESILATKATVIIKRSEPMTKAEIGRRVWPTIFAEEAGDTKGDTMRKGKAAAERVTRAMQNGQIHFEPFGNGKYVVDATKFTTS